MKLLLLTLSTLSILATKAGILFKLLIIVLPIIEKGFGRRIDLLRELVVLLGFSKVVLLSSLVEYSLVDPS